MSTILNMVFDDDDDSSDEDWVMMKRHKMTTERKVSSQVVEDAEDTTVVSVKHEFPPGDLGKVLFGDTGRHILSFLMPDDSETVDNADILSEFLDVVGDAFAVRGLNKFTKTCIDDVMAPMIRSNARRLLLLPTMFPMETLNEIYNAWTLSELYITMTHTMDEVYECADIYLGTRTHNDKPSMTGGRRWIMATRTDIHNKLGVCVWRIRALIAGQSPMINVGLVIRGAVDSMEELRLTASIYHQKQALKKIQKEKKMMAKVQTQSLRKQLLTNYLEEHYPMSPALQCVHTIINKMNYHLADTRPHIVVRDFEHGAFTRHALTTWKHHLFDEWIHRQLSGGNNFNKETPLPWVHGVPDKEFRNTFFISSSARPDNEHLLRQIVEPILQNVTMFWSSHFTWLTSIDAAIDASPPLMDYDPGMHPAVNNHNVNNVRQMVDDMVKSQIPRCGFTVLRTTYMKWSVLMATAYKLRASLLDMSPGVKQWPQWRPSLDDDSDETSTTLHFVNMTANDILIYQRRQLKREPPRMRRYHRHVPQLQRLVNDLERIKSKTWFRKTRKGHRSKLYVSRRGVDVKWKEPAADMSEVDSDISDDEMVMTFV
jgi:hypothetical protein